MAPLNFILRLHNFQIYFGTGWCSLSSSVPPLHCSKIIYHSWSAFRRWQTSQNCRACRRTHLATAAVPSATDLQCIPLALERLGRSRGSSSHCRAVQPSLPVQLMGSVVTVTFLLPGRIAAKAEIETYAVFGNKISKWKFSLIFHTWLFNWKRFLRPQNTIFPSTKGLISPLNDICYVVH